MEIQVALLSHHAAVVIVAPLRARSFVAERVIVTVVIIDTSREVRLLAVQVVSIDSWIRRQIGFGVFMLRVCVAGVLVTVGYRPAHLVDAESLQRAVVVHDTAGTHTYAVPAHEAQLTVPAFCLLLQPRRAPNQHRQTHQRRRQSNPITHLQWPRSNHQLHGDAPTGRPTRARSLAESW